MSVTGSIWSQPIRRGFCPRGGADLTVLALPAVDDEATSGALPGRLVVVAAPEAAREDLAQAAVTGFLTFTYSR